MKINGFYLGLGILCFIFLIGTILGFSQIENSFINALFAIMDAGAGLFCFWRAFE